MANTKQENLDNQPELKTEESTDVDRTVVETEPVVPEKDVSDEEKLVQLKEFRKNGNVTLDTTYSSFKLIRNTFKNKVSWTGPNQAYLLCVLNMNMEQALAAMDTASTESQTVSLRNDSIEAMSVFINQISGDNYHSAQTNLGMFLQVQQAISQLQSIDKQIKELEAKIENNSPSPE